MRPLTIAPLYECTLEELCFVEDKIFKLFRKRDSLLARRRRSVNPRDPLLRKSLEQIEGDLRRDILMYLPYLASAVVGGKAQIGDAREERGRRETLEQIAIALDLAMTGHPHFLLKRTTRGRGKESSNIEDEAKILAVKYILDSRAYPWLDTNPVDRVSAAFGVEARTIQRWCVAFATQTSGLTMAGDDLSERASDIEHRPYLRMERRKLLKRAASIYRDVLGR